MTARDPDSGKRWRLKGALYEHDFEPERLERRLRSRMKADRQQIEETAASELRRLGERSRAVANDALHTIEADMGATVARVRVLLLNAWLRPLVVGLSLFLAFSGGSWALMHWLSASIQTRIETLAALKVQIEQARETLVELEDPPWTVRGRPALKLSSE